jgi:REP-associated tyrosine transposase
MDQAALLHATKERRLSKAPSVDFTLNSNEALADGSPAIFQSVRGYPPYGQSSPALATKRRCLLRFVSTCGCRAKLFAHPMESERATWLRFHPQPWTVETEREYHDRFSGALERWLDAGHGSCVLKRHDCAAVVAEALRHSDGERIAQIAWVVMPNHVHAAFVLNSVWLFSRSILSWKGFTARHINSLIGRTGSVWQRDYFDRLIRNAKHLANCIRYIRRNPQKARLQAGEFVL